MTKAERDVQFGYWRNTGMLLPDGTRDVEGYRCDGPITRIDMGWWSPSVGIYDFRLNPAPDMGLTWVMGERPCRYMGVPPLTEMQPDGEFDTDKASIPWFVPIERDRFLGAFPHDSQYKTHQCWMRFPDGVWVRWPITRAQSDMCLYYSVQADPVPMSPIQAELVWDGVWIGGRGPWNRAEVKA